VLLLSVFQGDLYFGAPKLPKFYYQTVKYLSFDPFFDFLIGHSQIKTPKRIDKPSPKEYNT